MEFELYDAILARYMLSVCLSVRLFIISRYSRKKTANHRITPAMLHDSSGTLVYRRQRSWRNPKEIAPNQEL